MLQNIQLVVCLAEWFAISKENVLIEKSASAIKMKRSTREQFIRLQIGILISILSQECVSVAGIIVLAAVENTVPLLMDGSRILLEK